MVSPALYPHSLEFHLFVFAKRSIFQFFVFESSTFFLKTGCSKIEGFKSLSLRATSNFPRLEFRKGRVCLLKLCRSAGQPAVGELVNGSTGQQIIWATGPPVHGSIGQLINRSLVNGSTGQRVNGSSGQAVKRSGGGRSISRSTGHLVNWSTGQLVNRSAGHQSTG